MGSNVFSQRIFKPTAPDKGSFPLDHEGECKEFMKKYLSCLQQSKNDNSVCRQQSKDYLQCRMEKNLMEKEEWSKLGYADLETKPTNNESNTKT